MTFKFAPFVALGLAALALNTGAAAAAGAIVSTPVKGTYIYMTHRPSPGFAAGLALSDCEGKYGGGCRVLATYGHGCMALAHSHDGTQHSGWAIKPTPGQAQGWAMGQCEKYGAPCTLDVENCE